MDGKSCALLIVFLWSSLIPGILCTTDESTVLHQACPSSNSRSTNGTHEIFRGQDVVWQIPPNPKAIVFFAHGSDRNVFMFFDRGPGCEQCYGLPETRAAVLDALSAGYAVLTLKSIGNMLQSWPLDSEDMENAVGLVKMFTRRHSLEHLPLVGWGFSSGGWFVSSLTFRLPIRSLVMLCTILGPSSAIVSDQFPPAFFVQMITEPSSSEGYDTIYDTAHSMEALDRVGVQTFLKLVFTKPVTPALFLDRIPCMTEYTAVRVCEALRAGGWLGRDDYLVHDPGLEDWKAVVARYDGLPYCDEFEDLCLAEHVEEELNVALGKHWFTSDANAEIFAWLQSGNSSLSEASPSLSVV